MTGSEFIARVYPYLAIGLFLRGRPGSLCAGSQPAHVKWTLYPVPRGPSGQLRYMVKEIFTFDTLYRVQPPPLGRDIPHAHGYGRLVLSPGPTYRLDAEFAGTNFCLWVLLCRRRFISVGLRI